MFSPTSPKKEIPHIFNITPPKEALVHILYGYIIYKEEIYHRNTCDQIFTDGEGFVYIHPNKSKSQTGKALNVVTIDIIVPNTLISYNEG